MKTHALLLLALLIFLPSSWPALADDLAKDLKSKDFEVRLKTVEKLRKNGGEDCEKLLLKAATDRDWEVAHRAVEALGERGTAESMKTLLRIALVGHVKRLRLSAARSAGKIDQEEAAAQLSKRAVGQTAEATCEAMLALAAGPDGFRSKDIESGILRCLQAKEKPVRMAAARGVTVFTGRKRQDVLGKVLKTPETTIRAAALDALRAEPNENDLPVLLTLLGNEELNDVLSRRVLATIVAIVASVEPGEAADKQARRAVSGADRKSLGPEVAARYARLAGALAAKPDPVYPEPEPGAPEPQPGEEVEEPEPIYPPPLVTPGEMDVALEFALRHTDEAVRAAAVHALGRIATEEGLQQARKFAEKDPSARVRLHALRAVSKASGTGEQATLALLWDRLGKDKDPTVREYAAVVLGERDLSEAVPPLVKALEDEAWEVAVCAAVSLGKTRDETAVGPLLELAGHRDWRLRGAAVIGLGYVQQVGAIPALINALGDKDSAVKSSAWESLKQYANKKLAPTVSAWKEWWAVNEKGFDFRDLEKEAQQAKKYGYAPDFRGVYEDLDVIVLQSRGDTIEKLLERVEVEHRLTRSGQVTDAGLHPFAVFVANCTGEIVPKDVERLSWFVRTGGYLFGSCWALSKTIELVYPNVIRKLPIPGQVLANVLAEPCPTDSIYLDEVFGDGVTLPIYVLYGAHLIEVLDPERVEVLIDSPQCADTWPEGNLACWFDAGHGVVLDSANHFDLQGLERVDGLKTAADRMAYAMDHMGLTYADLRELAKKKAWNSRSKAAAEARDLSAFRFITNFVRHKRRTTQ